MATKVPVSVFMCDGAAIPDSVWLLLSPGPLSHQCHIGSSPPVTSSPHTAGHNKTKYLRLRPSCQVRELKETWERPKRGLRKTWKRARASMMKIETSRQTWTERTKEQRLWLLELLTEPKISYPGPKDQRSPPIERACWYLFHTENMKGASMLMTSK